MDLADLQRLVDAFGAPLADERGSVLEGRGAGGTRAEVDEIRAKRAAI